MSIPMKEGYKPPEWSNNREFLGHLEYGGFIESGEVKGSNLQDVPGEWITLDFGDGRGITIPDHILYLVEFFKK